MKNLFRKSVLLSLLMVSFVNSYSQVETLSPGSFIVSMGESPQTIGNALKPYGLIYDLIRNNQVPVKWIINSTKQKDGVDFTYNGKQYKGGTFIIPAEYRSNDVNTKINLWINQGVIGVTTTSPLSVEVSSTLKAAPRWTLDAQNGAIAEVYLNNAGISNTAFPNAYNWKAVGTLDACDDFFVMPHADPTWNTSTGALGHGRLYSWNKDCLGSIWLGCHAGSALSNMVNPNDRTQQTNFLVTKDPSLTGTSGNYTNSNSLLLWGAHSSGSVPYTHRLPADPNAQYLGTTDAAQLNGSEQVYIPRQGNINTKWNPNAKIISYDPTQIDVASVDPDLRNAAATIIYGRGFDSANRGYVMMESSHALSKGTSSDIAAQRVFLNFSFFQIVPKAPQLSNINGTITGQQIQGGNPVSLSISASSPIAGIYYTYQWQANRPGTFSNANAASTTFTPDVQGSSTPCVITCIVSDQCGRKSYQNVPIIITPSPQPPVAVNDGANLEGSCTPGTSITLNVLKNDTDPQGSAITLTSINQATASPANAGTWTLSLDSSITFTPNPNFTGPASINYTITNSNSLTSTATITITVGAIDPITGCSSSQVYAPSEVALIDLSNYISQSSTGAALNGTALDDVEDTYSTAGTDYLNFGTSTSNNLILSIGATNTLREKDTINIYWTNGSNGTATMSVELGASSSGPWTNTEILTNTGSGGSSSSTISSVAIPVGVSGVSHIKISAGNLNTVSPSLKNVWLDAVEYKYLDCVSRTPALEDDAATVLEDAPSIIDVLANDNDPQGLALTLKSITTQPSKGKVSINTNGTITYISNRDINGLDTFVYEACNTEGYCGTGIVTINITADGCSTGQYKPILNGGPITKIFQYEFYGLDSASTNSTPGNFRDACINSDNLTSNNNSSKVEVGKTLEKRGLFYFNITRIPSSAIVQSSNLNLYSKGGDNRGVQLKMSVYPLNNSWVENQVSWSNRSNGTPWTLSGGDTVASLANTIITSANKWYNWNLGAGSVQNWVIDPANNYGLLLRQHGTSLDYRHQFISKEETNADKKLFRPKLTVKYILPGNCTLIPNRAPLANPDYATVMNGQSVLINPLPNDADVDPIDNLSITGVFGISNGSATNTGSAITYTANISAVVPRTESLKYVVSDGNGGLDTAYVYVIVTNAPTVANSDTISTLSNTLVSINVTGNDNDPEGSAFSAPTITVNPRNGTTVINGNNIDYTPNTGFTGKDTLIYKLCEAVSGSCSPDPLCDTAIVYITVNNQSPVANNDIDSIKPCIATTFNIIENDTDPEGNELSVNIVNQSVSGTLVNNHDGTVTYTHGSSSVTSVTFTYTVTDNGVSPQTSAPATVTFHIKTPLNTAPVAVDDQEVLNMDETNYSSVRDNDYDNEQDQLTKPQIIVNPLHGIAVVLPNGLIKYIPNSGYAGPDTLTYRIFDSLNNPSTCSISNGIPDTAYLFYNVLSTNIVIAVNDENSTWENTPVSGGVTQNDYDPLSYYPFSGPILFDGFIDGNTILPFATPFTIKGIDTSGNEVANAGTFVFDANGEYTFTPSAGFIGLVSIPYLIHDFITDPFPALDTAILTITVNPLPAINSVIANNDENRIFMNQFVSNSLFVNDVDPQGNSFVVNQYRYDSNGDGVSDAVGIIGSSVTIGGITSAGNPISNAGTLIIQSNGDYVFTPATDFTGKVLANYSIQDNNLISAKSTATLFIDVVTDENGLQNDPPFAGDDFVYTNINTPKDGNFIMNDSDPNNDAIYYEGNRIDVNGPHNPIGNIITTVNGGKLQFYSDGTYTYTPALNYVGPDYYQYTICDNEPFIPTLPSLLCKDAVIHMLVAPGINITGTVFNDVEGLNGVPSNTINGVGIGSPSNVQLYVNLIDTSANNFVVATTPVNPDGTYQFTGVNPDYYFVQLSTILGTIGQPMPLTQLPNNWVHIGESVANAPIDLFVNGISDSIMLLLNNVDEVNFGIEQLPITSGSSNPSIINPGDTISVIVPSTLFTGSDFDGGYVDSIFIPSFPTNATSITINGVLYTSSTFPVGGIVIPANAAGQPLVIIRVDPIGSGNVIVAIPIQMRDNAGQWSANVDSVYMPFSQVVPVGMLSFTAMAKEKNVLLNWRVNKEIGISYYDVQFAIDGRKFNSIGKVNAQNKSTYDFLHTAPVNGMNYYRLKIFDNTGKFTYSEVRSVNFDYVTTLLVYPNPTNSSSKLSFLSDCNQQGTVMISTIDGKRLSKMSYLFTEGLNTVEMDEFKKLAAGTYLIELITNDKKYIQRLIKK